MHSILLCCRKHSTAHQTTMCSIGCDVGRRRGVVHEAEHAGWAREMLREAHLLKYHLPFRCSSIPSCQS
jgi:hypothetical protein